MGDAGCTALAEATGRGALAQCWALDLRDNEIGDAGCTALAEAVGRGALAQCTCLALAVNKIGDAGLNALKHLGSTAPPAAAKDGDGGGEGSLFTCRYLYKTTRSHVMPPPTPERTLQG